MKVLDGQCQAGPEPELGQHSWHVRSCSKQLEVTLRGGRKDKDTGEFLELGRENPPKVHREDSKVASPGWDRGQGRCGGW